jgi:ComEC/Rec2-related protein
MRYRLATLLLTCWIIGIFLGSLRSGSLPGWYPYSFLILPLLGIVKRFTLAALILTVLVGFGYSRVWRRWHWRSFPEESTEFIGTVVSQPDIRTKNQYLTVETREAIASTATGVPATGLVLVKADKYLSVSYGDVVSVKSSLENPAVFDAFNYPLFLERDHIFSIAPQAKVKVLEHRSFWSLSTFLAQTRGKLESTISNYIPEPEGSFLAGLLFGSKRAIPSDITDALKATSTSHLVAISGANITFIVAMALGLFPITNRWTQAGVVTAVSGGLSLLTGAPASVVRGAVISSTGALVKAAGRRAWPLATILIAASIMLFTNPLLITADPGFQLSFAAYGGLLLFSEWLAKLSLKLRIPPVVRSNFNETGAATLGTAPLTIAAGSFALRGLLVNPLVLWLIPPATALGFILLTSSVVPPLASLVAMPTWAILHVALGIITFSGHIGN